ncbi:hypothetical protein EVAR_9442_1 [Eumeta japonica]|uniref:Uncharacterized protein n=1 Tax=Eumeta variegata TaxID=151549 RepID=A0A4C1UEI8_EUMVA|nr:hypothetical protein EVAR_9442_1 [Eumeta japonica]
MGKKKEGPRSLKPAHYIICKQFDCYGLCPHRHAACRDAQTIARYLNILKLSDRLAIGHLMEGELREEEWGDGMEVGHRNSHSLENIQQRKLITPHCKRGRSRVVARSDALLLVHVHDGSYEVFHCPAVERVRCGPPKAAARYICVNYS